jgi:hypothetical protein
MATMPAMVAARRPSHFSAEAGLLEKVNETLPTPKGRRGGERRRIGSPPEQDHEEPGAWYAPDREAEAEVLIALGASRLSDVRLAPQEERVTLVTNVRLVCDATRPVTSQQPTVGNVTAVDWKPVNP